MMVKYLCFDKYIYIYVSLPHLNIYMYMGILVLLINIQQDCAHSGRG